MTPLKRFQFLLKLIRTFSVKTAALLTFFCSLVLFLPNAEAKKIEGKADNFLDSIDSVHNISKPIAYFDSEIGLNLIGGSAYIRNEVTDINPIHASLPSLSIGCGGIDFTGGALNVVSGENMKKTLKNITKSAGTHLFVLALEASSPIESSVMARLQHWQNQLNSININSCEIGTSLAEGLWPKGTSASEYICAQASEKQKFFADRIEAKHGCRDRSSKGFQKATKAAEEAGILLENFNLAWEVIKKPSLSDTKNFVSNEDKQDLYLNISGTLISKTGKKGNEPVFEFFEPKAEKALNMLIQGGTLQNAYRFNTKEPLDIQQNQSIKIAIGEKRRILESLKKLSKKIATERTRGENRTSLDDEQIKIIETTSFPISSLMALMAQWSGRIESEHVSLDECAEIIAFERVSSYLEEIVEKLLSYSRALEAKQFDTEKVHSYQESLEDVLAMISRRKLENYQKMSQKQKVIQFLLDIDRDLKTPEGGK